MVYLRPKLGEGEFSPSLQAARFRLADPPFSYAHARTHTSLYAHTHIHMHYIPSSDESTKRQRGYELQEKAQLHDVEHKIKVQNIFTQTLVPEGVFAIFVKFP